MYMSVRSSETGDVWPEHFSRLGGRRLDSTWQSRGAIIANCGHARLTISTREKKMGDKGGKKEKDKNKKQKALKQEQSAKGKQKPK
jgi:hypothetical protein